MNSTIIAAIIGGMFAIIASIGGVLFTRNLNNSKIHAPHERRQDLEGTWEGTLHQEGSTVGDETIIATFKVTYQSIHGEVIAHLPNEAQEDSLYMDTMGDFVHDRFLKVEYKSKKLRGEIQFGFVILELAPNGSKLSGRLLGYGPRTQGIVRGTLELHKKS